MFFPTIKLLIRFAVVGLFAGSALAGTVLTFDDLNARNSFDSMGISNSYQGFVWTHSGSLGAGWASATTSNPAVAPPPTPVSGQSYAWNWSGVQSLYISFPSPEAVNGAFFATLSSAYGSNASSVQMFGYDGSNNLVASSSSLSLTNSFQFLSAGFSNVSKLEIRGNASSQWFAIDSIDLSAASSSVPEPGTFGLFSAAAAMAGLWLRRSRR